MPALLRCSARGAARRRRRQGGRGRLLLLLLLLLPPLPLLPLLLLLWCADARLPPFSPVLLRIRSNAAGHAPSLPLATANQRRLRSSDCSKVNATDSARLLLARVVYRGGYQASASLCASAQRCLLISSCALLGCCSRFNATDSASRLLARVVYHDWYQVSTLHCALARR